MAKYSQEDLGKYAFEIVPQLSSKYYRVSFGLGTITISCSTASFMAANTLSAQSARNIVGMHVRLCMAM